MKGLLLVFCLLGMTAGAVLADEPQVTYGAGIDPVTLPVRDETCQYGFEDTAPGSGWSLYSSQQLGIMCPGPMTVTSVGFWSEFIVIAGNLDVVVLDDGVEVSRTTFYVSTEGVIEMDIPDVEVVGDACIMLCPTTYDGVAGEDYNSPPYGNSYWSGTCECSNAFSDNNLTIWAEYTTGPSPAESTTWGQLRSMFR